MTDRAEAVAAGGFVPELARCEQLMGLVRQRLTSRQFNPEVVPRRHVEMVLERHKVMCRDESKIDWPARLRLASAVGRR
jgi:hypothetical protein